MKISYGTLKDNISENIALQSINYKKRHSTLAEPTCKIRSVQWEQGTELVPATTFKPQWFLCEL